MHAAVVLISANYQRLAAGMTVLHTTIYAASRRVIAILTTIAGLFSLATGLGDKSLILGPVATVIVWGLAFSTTLTLIVVPLLYRLLMGRNRLARPTAGVATKAADHNNCALLFALRLPV